MSEPVHVEEPSEKVERFTSWAQYKTVDDTVVALYYLPHYADGIPDRWVLQVGAEHILGGGYFRHTYDKEKHALKAFDMVDKEAIKILNEAWQRQHFQQGGITSLMWKLKGTFGSLEEE